MDAAEARRRFGEARVARLATAPSSGRPHVVPIVFALANDVIYTAVDSKPKQSRALRRLENVRENPRVSVLADFYDDSDWTALWWVRADGTARILERSTDGGERTDAGAEVIDAGDEIQLALDALTRRYPQYGAQPPSWPVLAIHVERWSGWSAS